MPQDTPSPIDLPAAPIAAPGLGWTTGVIAVAALFLLATNAVSLRDWIDDRPPSPAQAQAAQWSDSWLELTRTISVGRPRDAMHGAWKQAEAARFHGTNDPEGRNADPADQR